MQTDHEENPTPTENPILSEHVGLKIEDAQEELKVVNELISNVIDTCIDLVRLNSLIPCKEFALAIMDAKSLIEHLNKFRVDGPSAPFIDVPLEASEILEDV